MLKEKEIAKIIKAANIIEIDVEELSKDLNDYGVNDFDDVISTLIEYGHMDTTFDSVREALDVINKFAKDYIADPITVAFEYATIINFNRVLSSTSLIAKILHIKMSVDSLERQCKKDIEESIN